MHRRLALFPETTEVVTYPGGEALSIAGCDLAALAAEHGTPLYLYDRATLETALEAYRGALAASYPVPLASPTPARRSSARRSPNGRRGPASGSTAPDWARSASPARPGCRARRSSSTA